MNILQQNGLPFEIDGVPISPDFRNMVNVELILCADDMSEAEKYYAALEQLFPVLPPDLQKAGDDLLWFHSCGKPPPATEGGRPGARPAPAYDFDVDAPYIYAAFYSAYGISLSTVEFLHWWEFVALFEGLTYDAMIKRIMYWRTVDPKEVPKYERAQVEKMKKRFALGRKFDDNRTLEELNRASLDWVQSRFAQAEKR